MAEKLVNQCTDEGVIINDINSHSHDSQFLGNLVWPCGVALAKFFTWREASPAECTCVGKAVLELGAGTGVVGLTLGRLGATVTLTDGYPEVLKLLQCNISDNSLKDNAAFHRLYFGETSTYLTQQTYDLVVAADVLYDVSRQGSGASALAHAIDAHVIAGSDTEVFLAYKQRTHFLLASFLGNMRGMGFHLERLEDGEGKAVAGAMGQPAIIYDGSRFVMFFVDWLSLEGDDADFSPNNPKNIEIFRLRRPLAPSLCTDEGIVIHEGSFGDENDLYGNALWPSGVALAKFVAWREADPIERGTCVGKAVLELGAGTGVVGLTLGRLGSTVTLTDGEPKVLPVLQSNIEANSSEESAAARCLYFGETKHYLGRHTYDLIVAADVLYEVGGCCQGSILAHALDAHVTLVSGAEVLLAYKHRPMTPVWHEGHLSHPAWYREFFTEVFRMGFRIERLEDDDGRAVAGAMGQPVSVYDGSRFVALHFDVAPDAIGDAAFGHSNTQKVQIFRLSRPSLLA